MGKATVVLTCAPPGSGKTYVRCARFLVDEWLPFNTGTHWSNFPIRFEPWEDGHGNKGEGLVGLAEKHRGMGREELRRRVQVIPPDVVETWRDDSRLEGPWTFFRDRDINGAHIAIDEAHVFWPNYGRPKHSRLLKEWLAEIRHRGATVEFITQNPAQVARELKMGCGERFILTNLENETEPICGCRLGDWMELVAGVLTREYRSYVRQERVIQWGDSWKVADSRAFTLDPWYFGVYDSYSAPLVTGGGGGMGEVPAWRRYSRLGLVWWFYRRNAFRLSWRAAAVGAYIWVACFGGQKVLGEGFQAGMQRMVKVAVPPTAKVPEGKVKAVASRGEAGAGGRSTNLDWDGQAFVEGKGGDDAARAARLAAGVARVRGLSDQLARRCKDLEAKLGEMGGAVMIWGDSVRFESGDSFHVGEVIDYGPYAGVRIVGIDRGRRAVRLSDGRLVRLGFQQRLQGAANGNGGPEFPGGVPGAGGEGFAGGEGAGARPGARAKLSGYAGGRSGAMVDGSDRGVGSGAGGVRRPAGVDGNTGSDVDGRVGRVGGSVWGGSGSERPALLPRTESAGQSGSVGPAGPPSQPGGAWQGGGGPCQR